MSLLYLAILDIKKKIQRFKNTLFLIIVIDKYFFQLDSLTF